MVIVQYVAEAATRARRGHAAAEARYDGRRPASVIGRPGDRHAPDGLASLLERAGTLDLADHAGWSDLTAEARGTVDRLIALGLVPDDLAVRDGEPAVVMQRTLAVALRRATASDGR